MRYRLVAITCPDAGSRLGVYVKRTGIEALKTFAKLDWWTAAQVDAVERAAVIGKALPRVGARSTGAAAIVGGPSIRGGDRPTCVAAGYVLLHAPLPDRITK